MKVYLRDVKKQELTLDVPDDATVEDLKKIIGEMKSCDPSQIRLIFNSKVLENSAYLSATSSDETHKIVYYIPKTPGPKPAQKQEKPEPAPAQPSSPQPEPAHHQGPSFAQAQPQNFGFSNPNPEPQSDEFADFDQPEGPTLTKEQIMTKLKSIPISETNVEALMEMGYTKEISELVLKACRNKLEVAGQMLAEGYDDADKLVDYLISTASSFSSRAYSIPQQQAEQLCDEICQNPHAFKEVMETGMTTVSMGEKVCKCAFDRNQLLQYALQKGYAQMTPDGKVLMAITPQASPEYNALATEFFKLTAEQQEAVNRLARQYNIDATTVLQYYAACDYNEENTKQLLQ